HSSIIYTVYLKFKVSEAVLSTFALMRTFIIVLFVSSVTALAAQSQGNTGDFKVLGLEECIQTAWSSNLNIKQAELGFESAESQMLRTKANVLPNLNGFANHNYNWGQRIDPFTNQFATTRVQSNTFGLSTDITLFNGFQNLQNIRAQEANLESSKYDLETQKNNIALSVSGAYLNILLSEELIIAAEQQVVITQTQLERMKKLVAAGSANLGNQYELEAQLGRDKSNLTQRTNEYNLAKLQLKQFLLIPADEKIELVKPKELNVEEQNMIENATTIFGYAQGSMPEIRSAEFSLLSAEKQTEVSKGGWYPTLSLSGSIGTGYSGLRTEVVSVKESGVQQIGFTDIGGRVFAPTYETEMKRVGFGTQLSDNFNQFVGLSLNVPIFNRFAVNNNVQQSKINQSIAEIQLEQEKLGLRQRIESARADALAARDAYTGASESVKANQKAFDFAQARFEAGALNVTEFNNSKNNLLIAQSQLLRSKYDYVFKVKVLDFYMGKPLALN
ncbi:MAG: TolC family protein, partial [Salibacteraceae bacterium]|nr:TolC family protein [Salibacteraceae bacterium]MDP4966143.1 TolC family protein [Salibacteraceae bacterium]